MRENDEFGVREEVRAIGICDLIMVPIAVRRALLTFMNMTPLESITFSLYTYVLSYASMLANDGPFVRLELDELTAASACAPDKVQTAILVALYTLSKSFPSTLYRMRHGNVVLIIKDGEIMEESCVPRQWDLTHNSASTAC